MEVGKYKSAEFLSHLIRGMAEGVIFIDDQNVVRLCNPVGGSIRGVSVEEITGKNFLECHPKPTHEKVLQIIEHLKADRKKELKRTVKIKGRFYEHTYTAVSTLEGKFLGVVAVSRDITDREFLEKELKEHAQKLEYSNRMKDLFADIVSHDFINPASIIRSYAELTLDESLPQEAAENVESIRRGAERRIELIENVSKFSKLEDAKSLSFEERDLGKLIGASIKEHRSLLEEKGMKVVYRFDEKYLSEVNLFIEDVFSNLISNAVKYSPNGSEVYIGIEDKGEVFLVSFADHAERIS